MKTYYVKLDAEQRYTDKYGYKVSMINNRIKSTNGIICWHALSCLSPYDNIYECQCNEIITTHSTHTIASDITLISRVDITEEPTPVKISYIRKRLMRESPYECQNLAFLFIETIVAVGTNAQRDSLRSIIHNYTTGEAARYVVVNSRYNELVDLYIETILGVKMCMKKKRL